MKMSCLTMLIMFTFDVVFSPASVYAFTHSHHKKQPAIHHPVALPDEAIYAYLNYMINKYGREPSVHVIFINILFDTHRTRMVAKHFTNRMPPVQDISGMQIRNSGFVDRSSGKPALRISITKFRWLSNSWLRISGSIGRGGRAGRGGAFDITRAGKQYRVIRESDNIFK